MIQLPKNLIMFAAVSRPKKLTYNRNNVWAIFMLVHKEPVSKKYKAVCTLCWLHTIAIDVVSLVGKERRTAFFTFKFQTTMTKDFEICNAGNNSICTATFAHETCAVSLSGDPYKDLAAFGFDLHRCQITYRKSPNKNGHTVTGRFNISGRTETGAGNSYPELILYVVSRQLSHPLYISLCHKQKRERNFASWLSRHPEYVAINQ